MRGCFRNEQIYIPIWIDLKESTQVYFTTDLFYLHSNMDRFESPNVPIASASQAYIYIPIWIDLKGRRKTKNFSGSLDLHSNMDRFESSSHISSAVHAKLFTFQYG